MKRELLIDTDPGIDDALAIMLANMDPDVNVRAITPVSGNVHLCNTLRNALYIKELLGMDARIAKGADCPLVNTNSHISSVHGADGLVGLSRDSSVKPENDRYAWDVIKEEADACKGELDITALGPLTNIATAFLRYPEIKKEIKSITIMGGSAYAGNVTPNAEFNIWTDPDSCDIVFRSGVPIRMCGLNGLASCALSSEELEPLTEYKGMVNEKLAVPIIRFLKDNTVGWEDNGVVIYDLITMAVYLYDIGDLKSYYVRCETEEGPDYGRTVVDFNGRSGKKRNVDVLFETDKQKYLKILKDMFRYYSK